MEQRFPVIKTIDDVLPYIENAKEFEVKETDDYYNVCYRYVNRETFSEFLDEKPFAIRRECRGIMFNKDGLIISRPLHKFFNMNERDETRYWSLPWHLPYKVSIKIDGSMVRPVMIEGQVRWCTKRGLTELSEDVEKYFWNQYVNHNPNHLDEIKKLLLLGYTPVFEYTGPENRVVIDYADSDNRLTLVGIRENFNGNYATHKFNTQYAGFHNAHVYNLNMNWGLLQRIKKESVNDEGVVIQFNEADMVKVKTDWYLKRHRIIGSEDPNHIAILVLDDELDDFMPTVPDENKPVVRKHAAKFRHIYNKSLLYLEQDLRKGKQYLDKHGRRDFAVNYVKSFRKGLIQKCLFCVSNGDNIQDDIKRMKGIIDKEFRKYRKDTNGYVSLLAYLQNYTEKRYRENNG